MQLLYMLSMMLVILGFSFLGVYRHPDPVINQSEALVLQMSVWHKAAIRVCVATTCASGVVDPKTRLPEAVKQGDAVSSAKFKTRYDATAKLLITYLDESALKVSGPTYGTVAAAIANQFAGEETSGVGQFDNSTNTIRPNYIPGYSPKALITVPASISGSIPDDAPVIATRM